jgi:hypothetical protein
LLWRYLGAFFSAAFMGVFDTVAAMYRPSSLMTNRLSGTK